MFTASLAITAAVVVGPMGPSDALTVDRDVAMPVAGIEAPQTEYREEMLDVFVSAPTPGVIVLACAGVGLIALKRRS